MFYHIAPFPATGKGFFVMFDYDQIDGKAMQEPTFYDDGQALPTEYGGMGVADIGIPTEATLIGKFLWAMLRGFALTFSAVTTAAFYWKYSGQAFDFLFGSWSPFITAIAGMLALDGASQVWAYLRGHKADTVEQMAIARAMTYFDLFASVLVTVIFLVLNAGFDVGIVNADGTLTSIGSILNILGVLVLTAGIVVNFVAATMFADSSAGNRQAVQNTQLAAIKSGAAFDADMQAALMTTRYQLANTYRQLPDVARRQGAANANAYIGRNFHVPAPNGRALPHSSGAATSGNTVAAMPSPSVTLNEIVDAIAAETGRNRVDILAEMLREARANGEQGNRQQEGSDVRFFN